MQNSRNFLVPLRSEVQHSNDTTEVMAACNCGSGDNHLSHAEWYWGNISRYKVLLREGKDLNRQQLIRSEHLALIQHFDVSSTFLFMVQSDKK